MSTTPNKTTYKPFGLSKIILILVLFAVLVAQAFFGYRLHQLSEQQEQLKTDFAEINSISLGLFSISQWQTKIERIVISQTRSIDLSQKQKKELQREIEAVIVALIDKAENLVTGTKKKSLRGKIAKFAVKNFIDVDTIKKKVPGIAHTIITKIDNPRAKRQLGKMALQKLEQIDEIKSIDSTLTANALLINKIYKRYNVTSTPHFNAKVETELRKTNQMMYNYCIGMLAGILLFLVAWGIFRKRKELYASLFVLSLVMAFILLAVGLTASMIEVDARIGAIDFVLLGQHITFHDQVLFFQSKSILDVVMILIGGSAIDSMLVGILILAFSILFPVMKLSSTGIHLLGKKSLAENKVIKYFAFQSGKWSMADVIVIAILMAYIGLNGLLETQLAKAAIKPESLTLISTHNTALQPGYIIFIAFVLFGLVLSTILKTISPHNCE
ncbi:paraquat-inducible protein A [Pedobacter sp. SL55]|uniref:paraquat-inducible protein A n=1 Tax=Pedobacter sp. SL55 TaxID=2995161 RepID=UPI002270932C|nr:paraquat-inducible protein A [Pedobacter sp. SL55]WAC39915.1 paraquat-inducible protein A [Pedobacter sp. SL55]